MQHGTVLPPVTTRDELPPRENTAQSFSSKKGPGKRELETDDIFDSADLGFGFKPEPPPLVSPGDSLGAEIEERPNRAVSDMFGEDEEEDDLFGSAGRTRKATPTLTKTDPASVLDGKATTKRTLDLFRDDGEEDIFGESRRSNITSNKSEKLTSANSKNSVPNVEKETRASEKLASTDLPAEVAPSTDVNENHPVPSNKQSGDIFSTPFEDSAEDDIFATPWSSRVDSVKRNPPSKPLPATVAEDEDIFGTATKPSLGPTLPRSTQPSRPTPSPPKSDLFGDDDDLFGSKPQEKKNPVKADPLFGRGEEEEEEEEDLFGSSTASSKLPTSLKVLIIEHHGVNCT